MKKLVVTSVVCMSGVLALSALAAADPQRQADVAKLGADVMPFSLTATTHIFTKTADGGVQRVVAKSASDVQQVKLVREHMHDIQAQFLKGDFSAPTHIHGAELTYRTADAKLVATLHQWFDAQLSDHGTDAMAGHMHDHGAMMKN